ncbi:serine/threonine-protein kinase, partial [Candidatus Protofrankia californiensis]|uniref:serine/threonine-protein kinase n=1 Tax=Candidatus Protofrankia californiensis TaxID=1839754 RepID=UPI001041694F
MPLQRDDPGVVGRYRITGRLGSGGMGVVYLGLDTAGRPVAVKVIRADLAADPEFRARFADEVAAARRVAPFCTAQVLDADPGARLPYLVTEYIDGVRLDDVVTSRGPLSLSTLQGVAVGVASALTAIHGAGIVHRDLKPSNVLLSYSGPRVIDFGIARAADAAVGRTRSGLVLGSAGWMAPEQMEGVPVGPSADVFAWGLLIAYAATGRHPFGGGAPLEVAQRMAVERPTLEALPAGLRPLVASTLARDPHARPSAERLVLVLLGDRGRSGGDTRAAVTQVLGDTWISGDTRPDGRYARADGAVRPAVGGAVRPAASGGGAAGGGAAGGGAA